MHLTFLHPFTGMISGPTGCGKTRFVQKLLNYKIQMIQPPPERVLWCYGAYQELFKELVDVEFHEGLPDLKELDGRKRTLLILDDLMQECDSRVEKIFTKYSHHANTSVFYLLQNLFFGGKQTRTISLNAQYMIIFKNVRDVSQITCLAKQMAPGNGKYITEAFRDATAQAHGYLCIDLKATTDDDLRIRTNIFPNEQNYAYVPK